MKLLLLADAEPQVSLKEAAKDCDLVVLLGDLFPDWIAELREIDLPKVGIHGNHDFDRPYNPTGVCPLESVGAINLHLNPFTFQGLTFTGFSGDMAYVFAENHAEYPKPSDPEALRSELAQLATQSPADIFISHYPSLSTLDRPHITGKRGLAAFREYIDRVQPRYHFHGHMHVSEQTEIGPTLVRCVYGVEVVEV